MTDLSEIDLMPPSFAEGLADWSRGDGTPDSPTYESAEHVRIMTKDPDFGACLELAKLEPIQRLRYMGEMPLLQGRAVEIGARLKVLRGPLPEARLAASAGGSGGQRVAGLTEAGPVRALRRHDAVYDLRLLIAHEARPGVDLVWDSRALYAHIGLDLLGPTGGVVRIERISARAHNLEALARTVAARPLAVAPPPDRT